MQALVFSPKRGMCLIADDDRVGVGDALVIANEPLIGLDRDRTIGIVTTVQQAVAAISPYSRGSEISPMN